MCVVIRFSSCFTRPLFRSRPFHLWTIAHVFVNKGTCEGGFKQCPMIAVLCPTDVYGRRILTITAKPGGTRSLFGLRTADIERHIPPQILQIPSQQVRGVTMYRFTQHVQREDQGFLRLQQLSGPRGGPLPLPVVCRYNSTNVLHKTQRLRMFVSAFFSVQQVAGGQETTKKDCRA